MKTTVSFLLYFCFCIILIAYILASIAQYIPISRFGVPHILSLGYFYLLFLLLLSTLIALFARKKYITIIGFVILLFTQFNWRRIIGLNILDRCTSPDMVVTTYNTRSFKGVDGQEYFEEFKYWIEGSGSGDILVLQEILFSEFKSIADELPEYHPRFFKHGKNNHTGVALYSRWPILDHHNIEMAIKGNQCIVADIVVPKDTIRVIAGHLSSNRLSNVANELLDSDEDLILTKMHKLSHILKLYFKGTKSRNQDLQQLLPYIEQDQYPVVFATDLNDTPFSPLYKQITKILKDGFLEAGKGLGLTYIGHGKGLRIDYVFTSEEFTSCNYKTLNLPFSDHNAVQSYLKL